MPDLPKDSLPDNSNSQQYEKLVRGILITKLSLDINQNLSQVKDLMPLVHFIQEVYDASLCPGCNADKFLIVAEQGGLEESSLSYTLECDDCGDWWTVEAGNPMLINCYKKHRIYDSIYRYKE